MILIGAIVVSNKSCERRKQIVDDMEEGRRCGHIAVEEETCAFPAVATC